MLSQFHPCIVISRKKREQTKTTITEVGKGSKRICVVLNNICWFRYCLPDSEVTIPNCFLDLSELVSTELSIGKGYFISKIVRCCPFDCLYSISQFFPSFNTYLRIILRLGAVRENNHFDLHFVKTLTPYLVSKSWACCSSFTMGLPRMFNDVLSNMGIPVRS
jgi:hypothetical protein